MDIRMRLKLGDTMPEELASRKTKVLETLRQYQKEVAPITEITQNLKDNETIKDSKTFVAEIEEKYGVSDK